MESEQQKSEVKKYPQTKSQRHGKNYNPILPGSIATAKQTTDPEFKSASVKDILQALFMADHDAAQLEQYLLENESVSF